MWFPYSKLKGTGDWDFVAPISNSIQKLDFNSMLTCVKLRTNLEQFLIFSRILILSITKNYTNTKMYLEHLIIIVQRT